MDIRDSLTGFLFSAGNGEFKTASVAMETDGSAKDMLQPSSGKRICLLKVGIYHAGAVQAYATNLGFAASGGTPTVFFVFNAYNTTDIRPMFFDFEGCPPIGATDQWIIGDTSAGGLTTSYCVFHYLEID
jgi:hypothetical protein